MTCQEGQVLQDANAGQANISHLYRLASFLAVVTILYNILEGVVSVYFGVDDDALSLFGFGLDSFVEVVSGIGVWHMIHRLRRNPESDPDRFERTALRITGSAFYILSIGLIVTGLLNLVSWPTTGDDLLGNRHRVDLHIGHVDSHPLQDEGGTSTPFGGHSGRCKLQPRLPVAVVGPAVCECRIRVDGDRGHRCGGGHRDRRPFISRRSGSL